MIGRLIYERFMRYDPHDYINLYIHTLPNEVITPLHWSESDVKYLKDIGLTEFNVLMPIPYKESYQAFHKSLSKYPRIQELCPFCLTWEAFTWSYIMTISRAFGQQYCIWKRYQKQTCNPGDEDIFGVTLYPLLDLVNHRPQRKQYRGQKFDAIRAQFDPFPAYVMYADQDYEPGMEITWTYGNKPNIELLYGYGFVIDKNMDEFIDIDVHYNDRFLQSYCTGIKIPNGCKYHLYSYEVNDSLLHADRVGITGHTSIPQYIGNYLDYYKSLPQQVEQGKVESKVTFFQAFLHYRFLVKDRNNQTKEKPAFRDLKRMYTTETKEERKISQQWAIAQKKTYYEVLKIAEREIGKFQLFDLFGEE